MTSWPWASSEATATVLGAFVAALQTVEDVARNKRAELDLKTGAKVRYGYADLDAVLEAVKPVLTAHGLAVTQPAGSDGVHAILMHSSGEWLSFPALQITAGQATPQAQGSAISYARRYQMLALLNIATEDDDGKAASRPKADAPSEAQTKKAMALFSEHGMSEKADRLVYTSDVLGRQVQSWADVRKAEAALVIDALEKVPA